MSAAAQELTAIYRKNSPLRKDHPLSKEHVEQISKARSPSDKYDDLILLARKQKGRDVADTVWKSVQRPHGYTLAQWKSRLPTLYDVDALDMKADRLLDPVTEAPLLEKCRLKATKGELTKAEFYHLATVLLTDHTTLQISF
ncbi:hypothetical protein C1J05_04095 [Sulfitobacter sp. JL08]|nr:hypothetical protein C1J05_04095 [Sulfitobacter sp. JL08]